MLVTLFVNFVRIDILFVNSVWMVGCVYVFTYILNFCSDNVDQGHSYEGDLRTEEESNRMTRIVHAIQRYEQDRTNELYNRHIIGRVTNKRVEVDYRINIRRVNFKWQRGFKIGELPLWG